MALLDTVVSRLNLECIRYVHWKSNVNIDLALCNIDDFDILIDPEFRETVEEIFDDLKIFKAVSRRDDWQENVFHYFGIDAVKCELVHIHVHYALPVGYDFDKNIVLPITSAYLDDPVFYKEVKLPQVEKEYIVLIIRLILKNSLVPFLQLLPNKQMDVLRTAKNIGVVRGADYREYVDLRRKVEKVKVREIIDTKFRFVSYSSFILYEATLDANNSLFHFFQMGRQLKKELRPWRTNTEFVSFLLSFYRLNQTRLYKIGALMSGIKQERKLVGNGGRIVAFTGGDGAGKSSNVYRLNKLLSAKFYSTNIHIGRPNRSPFGLIHRILSRTFFILGNKRLAVALTYLALAYDRRSAFWLARKLREKGRIVILDRIPLPGITSMDCPRIHTIASGKYKYLSKLEKTIYSTIKGVDLLFVLKLDPMIALKRRPEDHPETLLVRSGQIWNKKWYAPYAIEIDSGENSFQEVHQQVLENLSKCLATKFVRTEILGLTGTGKSTLINQIVESVPNTLTRIPFKQFLLPSLIGTFFGIPLAIESLIKTGDRNVALNCLQLMASLEVVQYWCRSGNFPASNLVLDQGPLFQLSLASKERLLSFSLTKANDTVSKLYDLIFFLEAPKNVLWRRVANRQGVDGRGHNRSLQEFIQFCDEYDEAFDKVIKNNTNVHRLDTEELTPSGLHQLVLEAINVG